MNTSSIWKTHGKIITKEGNILIFLVFISHFSVYKPSKPINCNITRAIYICTNTCEVIVIHNHSNPFWRWLVKILQFFSQLPDDIWWEVFVGCLHKHEHSTLKSCYLPSRMLSWTSKHLPWKMNCNNHHGSKMANSFVLASQATLVSRCSSTIVINFW